MAAPTLDQAPLWYLSRSTGIVSFVLLTLALCLGIASTRRALASPSWPRFATQGLHRNVSLLGIAFLVVHVVVTIADGFVPISWWTALVPFTSPGYQQNLWTGIGTLASDGMLVVVITSLLRLRMSATVWRWVHLSSYATWPLAWLHFLKNGTDSAHGSFGLWIAIAAAALVGAATGARTTLRDDPAPVRSVVR
ncbi:MAG: Ferric reductase domain protein transrane component domain protein [Frankiales bacterium]|nr:Ferric reductase domain protein transrane component domain protein [Frankiales bacterium]